MEAINDQKVWKQVRIKTGERWYDSHYTPTPLHSYKSTLIPINYTTLQNRVGLFS